MANPKARHDWVDAVRGLGIVLVYYGHVIQRGFPPGSATVADQLRLVYSFHMPLFFLLSGFFFRPVDNVRSRIGGLAARRLVPVGFFSLLLLPLWLQDELRSHAPLLHDASQLGLDYLRGHPELNWVTWFLVCLFVCEVAALVVLPLVRNVSARLVLGVAAIALGVLVCNRGLARAWFLGESVVALGFYSIGYGVWPAARRLSEHRAKALGVAVVCGAIVLGTYRLNVSAGDTVMLSSGRHGDVLYFTITALAGAAAVAALGMGLPPWRPLQWLGRNSLQLLGLNGLFFHYLNPKLAHVWVTPKSELLVASNALAVTALSLLACVPVVLLLNRYVPQLVGRPPRDRLRLATVGRAPLDA
jgi:fucose 4-O-acetylase-like acetyltransferase